MKMAMATSSGKYSKYCRSEEADTRYTLLFTTLLMTVDATVICYLLLLLRLLILMIGIVTGTVLFIVTLF